MLIVSVRRAVQAWYTGRSDDANNETRQRIITSREGKLSGTDAYSMVRDLFGTVLLCWGKCKPFPSGG